MIEETDYRGYTIEVHQDMDPLNPWEFGDCEPPIVVAMDDRGPGQITTHGNGGYTDPDDTLPRLDEATIKKHLADILSNMDYSADWLGLMQFCRDYYEGPNFVDQVRDAYEKYVSRLRVEDRFEAIAEAYGWLGVATYMRQIHGFCQRDFGYVLAVATPEWAESVGAPKETHERQLKNAIKLYEDYAFGSVYGFIIKDPDSHEIDDGSCWGFFGMDHEKSGLLEDAQMTIDADIPVRGKRLLLEARARSYVRNEAIQHRFSARDIKVSDHAQVEPASDGAWVTAKVFVPVSE